MTSKLFVLIITCVALSALAQMSMKIGMSSTQMQALLANGSKAELLWAVASNPYVVLGLSMYIGGAGLWLLVLSKVDLSLAYPFVGLGFVLTMFLGWIFLQEAVGPLRVLGTSLVAVGVYLIAKT